MSLRARFLAYARDFELAYLTDDFARIAPHFAPDAVHHVVGAAPFGADDHGRDAVVAGLKQSVAAIERRFDVRIPEILAGPTFVDGGLWMHWGLTLRRAGLPQLRVEGEHVTHFGDAGITRIDETLLGGSDRRFAELVEQHAARLRPAGSPLVLPDAASAEDIRQATLRSFVLSYGAAKSQQDVEGALAVCTPDFSIDTLPFGIVSRDRDDTARHLDAFFGAFPDYRAETEGLAVHGEQVGWWGRVSMTFAGPLLGLAPTGKRAELPAFCVFDVRDGALRRERFHFDLPALCAALELPLGEVTAKLATVRAGSRAG